VYVGEIHCFKTESARLAHSGGHFSDEAISVTLNASVICATFPLFAYAPASLHFSLVVLTTLVSCYNGASWYAHRFGKVTTSIDQLLREAEARNEEKDSQAHSE
jgi:hypothetical protein